MKIILTLFYLGLGIVTLVAVLHFIAAILMLIIPLPPRRQAALVQQLREEEEEYRRREAPMRAQMLQEQLSAEGRTLLASLDLAAGPADRQGSAQIVHLPKRHTKPVPAGNLGSFRT